MEIGAFEAKNKLGTLLDRVERGEEIIITRHGKRIARLVPNATRFGEEEAFAALERIRKRSAVAKGGFCWEEIRADRDSGRP